MSEILIGLVFLVFAVFLLIGFVAYFRKKGMKWIYFSLSALSLLTGIILITISDWEFADFGLDEKTGATITEKKENEKIKETSKEDEKSDETDTNKENTEENESVKKEPTPEENEEKKEEPAAPTQPTQTEPEPTTPEPSTTPSVPVQTAPEKISIPDDGTINYKVAKGDTLWSISQRANVTVTKIKQWNNLTSDIIYVDQVLKLYGKNNEPALITDPTEPTIPETPVTTSPSILITHGHLQQKEIAFTFDAGSDIAGIQILDVLKKHNVKATFFLTGKWAEKFPDYAKGIANAGHEIGNHSYSHPDAVTISSSTLIQEINQAEQIIKTASGVSPRPYFRFPYGSYNQSALKTVGEAGYRDSIQWSLDTIDWQQPSADVIVSRIGSGASNGDIVLMHIGGINTPEAVDRVIPILQEKGYQLVTLSQILN